MTLASPSDFQASPQSSPDQGDPRGLQPEGWLRYLSFSLDHKVIGLQYMVCGFLV